MRVLIVTKMQGRPSSTARAGTAAGSSGPTDPARAGSRAVRGRLRDPARGGAVVLGIVAASLLLAGLGWFAPEPLPALVLCVLGVPAGLVIARWLLAPGHTAVHGARIRLLDDERGWQVVRWPFGTVLADGSQLAPDGIGRALAERAVLAHVVGSTDRIESLALLDRVLAMDRFVRSASGRSTYLDSLTPEGRAVLARHVVDGITRDLELVETRRPRPSTYAAPSGAAAASAER